MNSKNENIKIEIVCCDCGKKFTTTQEWFDKRNKDGKLPCRKCRFSKLPQKLSPEQKEANKIARKEARELKKLES